MPNPGSDRPLRRVTLNLYEEDVVLLEHKLGQGWSTYIRDQLNTHVTIFYRSEATKSKPTLGDLIGD
jgi:hypothetical protein